MEKRETYYVSRKNVLTWLAAILMIGSAGLRIAYFCGKGADTTTVWLQIVLPAAACLIYCCILLLDGQEHFYRTALPVAMMAVYYIAFMVSRELWSRYIFVTGLALLAYVIFYKQLTSGHVRRPWLLALMNALVLAVLVYDSRTALLAGSWDGCISVLPDLMAVLGIFLVSFAVRPHSDGKYHPTWGDRSDGRRVRTLPAMSAITPYIMVGRVSSSNCITDEQEITEMEKYIRQKRREGLTNLGINHVMIAAYVRCVAKFPAVNRFISGQKVYSRGDEIQYCMTIKKEMNAESPDTCIKLHLKPTDTIYDVYRKMDEAVQEVKNTPLNSDFDQTAKALMMIPSPILAAVVWLLRGMDYFGLLPKFLLEVSPFHGSVFFTSMGSLGIPAIVHHLYDFGNLPVFVAFGRKYRRNEIAADGTVQRKKYIDMTFNLDERICDGFYYAAVLKYLHRLLDNPERLDTAPETVEQDIP